MGIQELALIQRKPYNHEIDIKGTMQAFAEELIRLKDEEKRIRTSRKYRQAIIKVFNLDHGFVDEKGQFWHIEPLVYRAAEFLRDKKQDKVKLWSEIRQHIILNHNVYLSVRQFTVYGDPDAHVRLKT